MSAEGGNAATTPALCPCGHPQTEHDYFGQGGDWLVNEALAKEAKA